MTMSRDPYDVAWYDEHLPKVSADVQFLSRPIERAPAPLDASAVLQPFSFFLSSINVLRPATGLCDPWCITSFFAAGG